MTRVGIFCVLASALLAFCAAPAKDLVWNGGDGGTWSGSSEVWLDGATPCSWEEGATAVFSGSGLVVVQDEVHAGGIRFTATGTTLVGPGLVRLNGALDAAAATTNAVAVRLYADPAMSKTGAGTVALGNTRGTFAIDAGTVLAGGYNMHDTAVTLAEGASLKALVPVCSTNAADAAGNLVANGSFETPVLSGYSYVGVNGLTSWTRGAAARIVLSGRTGSAHWGNDANAVQIGDQIVGVQMGGEMSQTLTVPADGLYDLSFRFFRRGNLTQYDQHQIYIYLDGALWQTVFDDIWSGTPKFTDTGAVYLKAGAHTLKVAGEGNWGDTTTFVDDFVAVPPVLADATSIPAGRGTVVDVASGETTFTEACALVKDAEQGFAYFTKTGAGRAVFTQDLALPCRTVYDVEGEAVYEGANIRNAYSVYKLGTGSITIPSPTNCNYYIVNGSLKIRNFTGAASVGYKVSRGVTAGFYPGLAAGDATMNALNFSGNGTCLLGTLGDGHTLTVLNGGLVNTPGVRFDVGAGDTLKFGNLRADLVGNEREFCETDVLKLGAGALELTTHPTCYPPTTLTVREGPLTVDFTDDLWRLTYTFPGGGSLTTNVYALLRGGATPLVLGDYATPADATAAFYANCASFRTARPITVNARLASATLGAKQGTAHLAGPVTCAAPALALSAAAGATLAVGALTAASGATPALSFPGAGRVYLDGTVGAGFVPGAVTASLSAGYNRAQTVAFPSLSLAGASEFSFEAGANDRFDVAGALTLGTLEIALRDDVTGGAFDVPGTYTLFTCGTLAGDVSTLSLAAASQQTGYTYAFAAADGRVTLAIAATAENPVHTWTGAGDGAWTDATWDRGAPPSGADLTARFPSTTARDATVTLPDGAAARIGTLLFESLHGYTLTNGTLEVASAVTVNAGTQTVFSALANAGTDPVALTVADGALLVLGGTLTGPFHVASGTVILADTAVVDGALTVAAGATLRRATLGASGTLSYEAVTGWNADQTAVYLVGETGRHYFTAYNASAAVSVAIDGVTVLSGAKGATHGTWVPLTAGAHLLARGSAATSVNVRKPSTPTSIAALDEADLRQDRGPEALAGAGTAATQAGETFALVQTNAFGTPFTGTLRGASATAAFVKKGAGGFAAAADGGTLVVKEGTLGVRGTAAAARVAPGATLDVTSEAALGGLTGAGAVSLGTRAYACGIAGDADCGISPAKTYTHLCNFTTADFNLPVNGVTFSRHTDVKNANCTGWGVLGEGSGGVTPAAGEKGFAALVRKLSLGNARTNTLWISGLTPGKTYEFRLYLRPYGACDRRFVHNFLQSGRIVASVTWDPYNSLRSGGSQASSVLTPYSIVACRYVADETGTLTMQACKANLKDTNGFHYYAFSNEEVADAPAAEAALTVEPAAGEAPEFRGTVSGDRALAVAGAGTQVFGAGAVIAAKTLSVTGAGALLKTGATAFAPAAIAAGAELALWPEAQVGGVTGAGTLALVLAEENLRDRMAADGTFPLANAHDTYPRVVSVADDTASGISPHKTYTVVHSWGSNGILPVVNDVAFTRSSASSCTNAQGVGVVVSAGGAIYASKLYIPDTCGIYWLYAQNVANSYNSASGYLKATGLTPGVTYEARVYLASFSTGKNREARWYAAETKADGTTNSVVSVQDVPDKPPFYVAVRYTAAATEQMITWYRVDGYPNVPHLQAFSNEIVTDNVRYLCVSNDCSFAGAVTGPGELVKTGPAAQTFTGALDAKALWTVREGTLAVANPASVLTNACVAGGTLRAVGTVTGDLGVLAGGALAVGAEGLVVKGNAVLADGAALTVPYANDAAGTLDVKGALTLPATLTVTLDGTGKPHGTWELFRAGSVQGEIADWTVIGADGQRVAAARVRKIGTSVRLTLATGSVLLFR